MIGKYLFTKDGIMTQRTAQLIGWTEGCDITVTWNGEVVLQNQAIAAAGTRDGPVVLAKWYTDTEIVGDIPLVIECWSGNLWWANIYMNMLEPVLESRLISQPRWTTYTPTEQELFEDLAQLTDAGIQGKYAMSRLDIVQHIGKVELTSIENNFRQPINTNIFFETDGKKSVVIDDTPVERHDVEINNGAWQWEIATGSILRCLFLVEPPVVDNQ